MCNMYVWYRIDIVCIKVLKVDSGGSPICMCGMLWYTMVWYHLVWYGKYGMHKVLKCGFSGVTHGMVRMVCTKGLTANLVQVGDNLAE